MWRLREVLVLSSVIFLVQADAQAAIVETITDGDFSSSGFADDGVVGGGEYADFFMNGGGSGFGGTVGSASLHVDSDTTNIYFGFDPGNTLNDFAILYLDTRAGGVADAQMNDNGDGSRFATSQVTRDSNDLFPVSPDFAVVFGSGGTTVFELTTHSGNEGSSTSNHLAFHIFQGDQSGNSATLVREISLTRALLGNPTQIDLFMAYASNSAFNSDESLPASALNSSGNPGFGSVGGTVTYDNANRFVVAAVPEPSAVLFGGVVTCLLGLGYCCRRCVGWCKSHPCC